MYVFMCVCVHVCVCACAYFIQIFALIPMLGCKGKEGVRGEGLCGAIWGFRPSKSIQMSELVLYICVIYAFSINSP